MATTKARYNQLICIAENVLQNNDTGLLDGARMRAINESYNGKIAAFGVSVAMTGLLPTLVNYYADKESRDTNTRNILDVIAKMFSEDISTTLQFQNAKALLRYAIVNANDKKFKQDVIDCSVALKQVFRTYIEH